MELNAGLMRFLYFSDNRRLITKPRASTFRSLSLLFLLILLIPAFFIAGANWPVFEDDDSPVTPKLRPAKISL